jgi:hypothetical protein
MSGSCDLHHGPRPQLPRARVGKRTNLPLIGRRLEAGGDGRDGIRGVVARAVEAVNVAQVQGAGSAGIDPSTDPLGRSSSTVSRSMTTATLLY